VTRVDPLKDFLRPRPITRTSWFITRPIRTFVINDLPKIVNLKRLFPDQYRDKPVLTAVAP